MRNYLASGRAVIGLRTASHAFDNYFEFSREILGGVTPGISPTRWREWESLRAGGAPGPGRGVTLLNTRKLYKNPTLADDAVVLLEGAKGEQREPVVWVRQRPAAGRVFHTSLGTREDFAEESFRRLLTNAIFWSMERDEARSRREPIGED